MSTYQRPFQSGSRQAPDPFDQFLEKNGYFRKHTARDPSSLFRVISEQLFDTQSYHETVRKTCVEFMTRYPEYFEKHIDMNYDKYLLQLSKPRTYGTMIELRALGLCYQRNIVLFEGFTTGNWFLNYEKFDKFFYVFFTPANHFDSVFTQSFIEKISFCQSICYNILYGKVFQLPDVVYSVERMLHDPIDYEIGYQEIKSENDDYYDRICLSDGRHFELDRPYNTKCILDDYLLCGFHNFNFENLYKTITQRVTSSALTENADTSKLLKMYNSMLPKKNISCVRQIFENGITPFPYKVAKALDSDIYRNIEFDAWVEKRKEERFRNLYTTGSEFQIGVKCLVKLRHSQQNLYNGHIQDMKPNKGDCLVFIEELGEKRSVPYANLNKLPGDHIHRWTLPYTSSRYLQLCASSSQQHHPSITHKRRYYNRNQSTNYRKYSNNNYYYKKSKYSNVPDESFSTIGYNSNSIGCKLQPFTSICNYQANYDNNQHDIIAMPLLVSSNDDNSSGGNDNKTNNVVQSTKNSNDKNNNNNGKINSNHKNDNNNTNGGSGVKRNDVTKTDETNKNPSKNNPFSIEKYELNQQSNDTNICTSTTLPTVNQTTVSAATTAYPMYPRYEDIVYPTYGYEVSPSYQPMFYGGHPTPATMTTAPIAGNYMPSMYHAATRDPHSAVNMMQTIPIFSPTQSTIASSAFVNGPNMGLIPTTPTSPTITGLLPIKRKDLLQSKYPINLYAKPSYAMDGSDFPDMATNRFFYNLGHEFFKYLQSKFTMATLHQLTIGEQRLTTSSTSNDMQLNIGIGYAPESDVNFLNTEFNNLNIQKDRNSVTKNKNHENPPKRRLSNMVERKANRRDNNNKRDYRNNPHNGHTNNTNYGSQNHYNNHNSNHHYQSVNNSRYHYSKKDSHHNSNPVENAALTSTSNNDGINDLNATPRKSMNQQYIGGSADGAPQFIATTISGAQYYQPTGYPPYDPAYEPSSVFMQTYGGMYSPNGFATSYGPPMTIASQRSDDCPEEANDDGPYIAGHPPQLMAQTYYYPPVSTSGGAVPVAAAPLGYWYPPPPISGQIPQSTTIHSTFTQSNSGSSISCSTPSVN